MQHLIDQITAKIAKLALVMASLSLASHTNASTMFSVIYGVQGVEVVKEHDPYYNVQSGLGDGQWDGISTVFRTPVNTVGDTGYSLISSLYGRHYDSDPTLPGETGLLDRAQLPIADSNAPQWILKHGLPPSEVGSTNSATLVNGVPVIAPASYIALRVDLEDTGHGEEVVFEGAHLEVTGFTNIDSDIQIWAASNSDGFSTYVQPVITQPPGTDTDVYTFEFSGLDFTSSSLELRIYGVLGQDQGTFLTAIGSGSFHPPPLPEPSVLGLASLGLATTFLRRKRA